VRKWLVVPALVLLASAAATRSASADWTLTPFIGWNLGGSTDVNAGAARDNASNLTFKNKVDYGVSLAAMGKGAVGFEVDFGYSPNFFERDPSGSGFQFTNDSNVTTLTGNVIVAAPIGGHGRSIRPYVVGGLGLIRANIQSAARVFSTVNKNDLGLDVGAGVMGFFAQNIGLRGDVRYFHGFRGGEDDFTGLALSDFKFWRGSIGVSFKF